MKTLNEIRMGGVDVLPLIEGGKGIGVSTGVSRGHWAEAGGAGTFSAVNADYYDADGNPLPQRLRRPHPARAPRGAHPVRHQGRDRPGQARL